MRFLEGNSARIGFSTPITLGHGVYTGPLTWELGDSDGNYTPVDPTNGAQNSCTQAAIPADNPQQLALTKLCDGVNFFIRASYPGTAGPCSVPMMTVELAWAAPNVYLNPLCVTDIV